MTVGLFGDEFALTSASVGAYAYPLLEADTRYVIAGEMCNARETTSKRHAFNERPVGLC